MQNNFPIGIMGAMPEETEGLVNLLTDSKEETIGMRTYYSGKLYGKAVVIVFSRWGKVAAATTVSTLIHRYKISEIIFTGVAGAISHKLKVGDIVLGQRLIQHDMDGRPLMEKFEIPLLGKTYFESGLPELQRAEQAIKKLLEEKQLHSVFSNKVLEEFKIETPQLFVGEIASGDRFFADNSQKEDLQNELPDVLCVEMEGAAVAQVCYEYAIPFTIIRTISDTADDNSHLDFPKFIQSVSSKYSVEIIKNLFHS